MPKQNEGFRLNEWGGPLRFEPWTIPDPGPGDVQVEVEACGVGMTVLNNIRGENWADPALLPRVPGHEIVGRVVATGDGVDTPTTGDRVLVYFYLSCFACDACRDGREERCQQSDGRIGIHRDGGYARLSNLPAGNTIGFPSDLDAVAATVIPDAVATPLHVCRFRLGLQPGERVAVVGAGGGVGAHMVQMAMAFGTDVVGLDRGAEKRALVESLGATAVDSTAFDHTELDPVDVVIDLVGTPTSLAWGVGALRQGGRLCVLTTFRGVVLPVEPRLLVARELAVMGSHYASRAEVADAAALVVQGKVRPVVGQTVTADGIHELHERLAAGSLLGRGALVWD